VGGRREWYVNGARHNVTGPSIVDKDRQEYWLNDHKLDEKDWRKERTKYPFTCADGTQFWVNETGRYHRDERIGPAIYGKDGTKQWFRNGVRHRRNGAATIHPDGTGKYWLNGHKLTREEWEVQRYDWPECFDTMEIWYNAEGQFHREGDKPAIIHHNGSLQYWVNGAQHREFGPSVVSKGYSAWHRNGELCEERWYNENGDLHREDGPAITGKEFRAWYTNGVQTAAETKNETQLVLSRSDGTKVIKDTKGNVFHFYNNQYHRDENEGPAVTYASGEQQYCSNGKLHRINGPAVIYGDGTQVWYRDGNAGS
jgi:hypothetical protein